MTVLAVLTAAVMSQFQVMLLTTDAAFVDHAVGGRCLQC